MSQIYSNILFHILDILLSESSLLMAVNLAGCAVSKDFNLSTAAYTLSITKSAWPTEDKASDSSAVKWFPNTKSTASLASKSQVCLASRHLLNNSLVICGLVLLFSSYLMIRLPIIF